MQQITPKEWLMIDFANHCDVRGTWEDKLAFFEQYNAAERLELALASDNPYMAQKALNSLDMASTGAPIGHMVGLDATASGISILSTISGCRLGAKSTNLLDPNNIHDVYVDTGKTMTGLTNKVYTRKDMKRPIMTKFYGAEAQPKKLFPDEEERKMFFETLRISLPGAWKAFNEIQDSWQEVKAHSCTFPDGFYWEVPNMVTKKTRIEVDELNHLKFNYVYSSNEPSKKGISLAANLVQGIDAYITREMIRKAKKQGFEMLHAFKQLNH